MSRTSATAADQLLRLGNGGARRLMAKAVREGALEAEAVAKTETYPASGLHVRSGRLRASIGGSVRETAETLELVLGAGGQRAGKDVRYAGVHEGVAPDGTRVTSTTIRPVKGEFLRIPTVFGMTAAGVDRYPGPLRETANGLFRVAASDDGRLYLVPTKSGKRGAVEPPSYNLVRQVKIPARPFLRPALTKVRPALHERIRGDIAQAALGVSLG